MILPSPYLNSTKNSSFAAGEPRAGVEHDLYVQLADSTGSLITAASDGFSADSVQVCTARSTLACPQHFCMHIIDSMPQASGAFCFLPGSGSQCQHAGTHRRYHRVPTDRS